MKSNAILLAACLLCGQLSAQVRGQSCEPPEFLAQTFVRDFPDVLDVSWEKLRSGYLGLFQLNGFYMEAKYSEEGKWQCTDITVQESHLPAKARQNFKQAFPGASIRKIRLHDAIGDKYFEVTFVRNGRRAKVMYDDQGNYLR